MNIDSLRKRGLPRTRALFLPRPEFYIISITADSHIFFVAFVQRDNAGCFRYALKIRIAVRAKRMTNDGSRCPSIPSIPKYQLAACRDFADSSPMPIQIDLLLLLRPEKDIQILDTSHFPSSFNALKSFNVISTEVFKIKLSKLFCNKCFNSEGFFG